MRDIKVGDKVEILTGYYGTKYKGKKYTIKKKRIDGWNLVEDKSWFYLKDEYRGFHWDLVPSYTWESKFNIGDKVDDSYRLSNYNDIITSIKITDNGVFYTLKRLIGEQVCEDRLSLYEEPTVKEMTVKEIEEELGYTIKVVK